MTDEIPEVRCPDCGQLDWGRDGFVVRADGPRIDAARVAPSRGDDEEWRCLACGHPLASAEVLASSLSELQLAHWE